MVAVLDEENGPLTHASPFEQPALGNHPCLRLVMYLSRVFLDEHGLMLYWLYGSSECAPPFAGCMDLVDILLH